jgi:phosphatidylglycerol:prolipoprotein diacylglycerol transferase
MYPNLYYWFKDWFGVEVQPLQFLNTFGLMVAIAFAVSAWLLTLELKRKERQGLLKYQEETMMVGMPASMTELLTNGILGFLFGFKILGLFISKPDEMNPQDYIFSSQGNWFGGLLLGGGMLYLKWKEKNKQKLAVPEKRNIRIWPHDRVGDIIVLGLVFGILGAKLFDNFEHWDEFIADPIGRLFSQSGLTFYGGLILATIAILIFARKKEISIAQLVDAAAPVLMLAYAIGRLGCQISGDGDWGVYNSAYVSDSSGNVHLAKPGEFESALKKHESYFLRGIVAENDQLVFVTDRTYPTLKDVPHLSVESPSWIPVWMIAYPYPQNVNKDGIKMPGITDEHNRTLPSPVFPTPLYETLLCTLLFMVLWVLRKRIKTPWFLFSLYLFLNGLERFLIEFLRVNNVYDVSGGIQYSQAQLIAIALMSLGLSLPFITRFFTKKQTAE